MLYLLISTITFGAVTEQEFFGIIPPYFNGVKILIQVTHNKNMLSIPKLAEEQPSINQNKSPTETRTEWINKIDVLLLALFFMLDLVDILTTTYIINHDISMTKQSMNIDDKRDKTAYIWLNTGHVCMLPV